MQKRTRFVIDDSMRFLLAYLKVNEVQVLQKANLPVDFFNRNVRSLSTEEYFRLWEALIESVDSRKPIPLLLENLPIAAVMSPPILAALCSKNFETFVRRIKEFKPLIGPLVLELETNEETLSIHIFSVDDTKALHPEIVASEFIFFTKIFREATGQEIAPVSVEALVQLDEETYGRYFSVKPGVGDSNCIRFRLQDCRIPFQMRNESVWEYFEPELRRRLDELEKDSSFAEKVRAVLFEILPMGRSSIEDVAEKLIMSGRTMQRRLQAEKTSFQQQLNHSRKLLARHHLTSSLMTVSEIALLLGYEEPSSFSRAFHSWTGSSPEAFRTTGSPS